MEAMTLATRICLVSNGVLQQYAAPLDVYNRPANLFVADFVGNPSMNFVDGKGKQQEDGSVVLDILGEHKAKFVPNEKILLSDWRAARDKEDADKQEFERQRLMKKGAVEKSNKDEVFKYHVQKVEEQDESIMDEPVITDEDFVLGIRPEAIDIEPSGKINTKIYGAMPTGMESTLKLRVGEFLLTSVIFGNSIYLIGQDANIDIKGKDILLFDRKSGKLTTAGTLEIM
jgi:ABC-type sugar transport system ATPase subunit